MQNIEKSLVEIENSLIKEKDNENNNFEIKKFKYEQKHKLVRDIP